MLDNIAQLKAAYEREVNSHQVPLTSEGLPLSYEEITDSWLTDVLCSDTPGVKVTSHRLGPPDDGNTSRRRMFLTYADNNGARLPESVFCKSSFRLATRISVGICGGVEGEVNFYNDIRDQLDIEAPVAIWAKANPNTLNSIIIFRDLGLNTEFCSLSTQMTEERVREQMALLARFHAHFYDRTESAPGLAGLQTWPRFFERASVIGFERLCTEGFKKARDVIPHRLFQRAAEIWPVTLSSVERHNHLPHTLLHADVHLRNWYIASSGKMGLGDWANVCKGHWSRDVAYTISTAMDVEQRRALGDSMLVYYLEKLREAGGAEISFRDAQTYYRQQLFGALAWWTITLNPSPDMPDMQPKAAALEMIRRISHAIDDADAIQSFS